MFVVMTKGVPGNCVVAEISAKNKKDKMKIIGLFPLTGNGGIASWTKKFLSTFPNNEYQIIPVNISPEERRGENLYERIVSGMKATRRIKKELQNIFCLQKIDILHTTTSGSFGSLRDVIVGKLCNKYGVKKIMHCRYGCIPEAFPSKGLTGWLLRRSMKLYDQIWVLDNRTYQFLQSIKSIKDKVYLTPNSIEIKKTIDSAPKTYKRVAFVGNLIPSKGLYELTEAAVYCNVRLDIIGPGPQFVIEKIKSIAGDKFSQTIFVHGRLPNDEAVQFMQQIDMIALPTYYRSEAFPMSIIEAMSLSKLVISCKRAAIPDMLTALDGTPCGLLVEPKSTNAIVQAINWCQQNHEQADLMRKKAYEKVYEKYRTEVVYELYRENYKKLID